MAVDFKFKRAPAYRVASVAWKGPWSDARIRAKFYSVAAWARARGLRTGNWVFREPAERSWEVGIEILGKAKSEGAVRIKTYPHARVASILFDPKVVAARVAYHGMADWLRWRRKEGEVKSVGQYREIYPGDPWKDKTAYARTEIQIVVRP